MFGYGRQLIIILRTNESIISLPIWMRLMKCSEILKLP